MNITFKGLKQQPLVAWFMDPEHTKKAVGVLCGVGLLAILLFNYGCAPQTVVKPIETQTVDVPVAQPCPKVVDPNAPPAFPASDEAMRNIPYPLASANLKNNPADPQAKAQVDANVYYLLQIMAADRLVTRAWAGKLASNLSVCQAND